MNHLTPLTRTLTTREREILLWVSCGKTAHDIGGILGISVRTVRSHIENSREKLGASSITHAIVKAVLLGEITLGDLTTRLSHEGEAGES